jgi:exopolysaccharide biosynthesis polyprenyl glycosylphosphotransferase
MGLEIDIESAQGALSPETHRVRPDLRAIEGGRSLKRLVVAGRHSGRDAEVRRLLLGADLTAISVALLVAMLVLAGHPGEFLWGTLTLPAWVFVLKAYGLYDRDTKRISHGSVDDLPWIFHAILLGALLLIGFYRLTPPGGIELADLAAFCVIAIVLVAALRILARGFAASLLGPERVLLIGDGPQVVTLARKLASHPEYGVEPVGRIACATASPVGESGLPVLGRLDEFEDVVEAQAVERIVVAHEDYDDGRLFGLLCRCRELGVKLSVLPQLFDALGPSVELDDVEGVTVLGITPPVLPRSSRFLKRAMDVVGAGLMLVFTAPVLAIAAIAIKVDSPGPAFFRQTRIGREGRRFQLLKCRTMCADAEQLRAELLSKSKDPGWLHVDHDPRVTRVGRVLRRTSLDELPQLWNVLRGEMSLVGPRPIQEEEDRQLEGWRRTRIDLTPGLTGLWQVLGRANIPFEEMIKLDYLYVTNWSLWTDISLILRTLPAVLLRRGVN